MMLKRTYSIHILLATFIFTNGCGVSSKKNEVPVFSINAAMRTVQNISSYERNIATSICYALESKSKNFKTTDYLGTRFVFQTQQRTCGVAGPTNTVNTILSLQTVDGIGNFHYVGGDSTFNDFAQTDTSGYLSQVCTKIKSNTAISNTTSINGMSMQIVFFKDPVAPNLDAYTVQYFAKTTDDKFKMTSAETFKFRTQLTYVVGNIMGMDEYYSKETICSTDTTKSSIYEQVFTGR